MFPVRDCFIPNLGTFYSQLGNNSFPTWENFHVNASSRIQAATLFCMRSLKAVLKVL